MTKDDIFRMAREAGRHADEKYQLEWNAGGGASWQSIRDERFASLVAAQAAAEEREKFRAVGCVLHAARSNMALNSSFEDRQILSLENVPLYEPERITLIYVAIRERK